MSKKILISVIAYNEEGNIEKTLRDLMDHNFGYDIVVINNASTDKTREICEKLNVKCINHCVNSGGSSGTILSYFIYANRMDYDVVCQFDGDGQHIASELPKIITPVLAGEYDIVIGSRFIEKTGFQSYFFRRIGIRLFGYFHKLMTGKTYTDVTSGFRAYSKRTINIFGDKLNQDLYDAMNQFLLIAHYSGLSVTEVPVQMRSREHGKSEFNLWKAVLFPLKGVITFLSCYLQKAQYLKFRQN